jgi:hypothetical protein
MKAQVMKIQPCSSKVLKSLLEKGTNFKGKKRACYECGKIDHFITNCPNKNDQEGKKKFKKDKFKKGEKGKGYNKKKKYGQALELQWREFKLTREGATILW